MGDLTQDRPSSMEGISIAEMKAEHYHNGFGIFHPTPRLSWRFAATKVRDWKQSAYEIVIKRRGRNETYEIESCESSLVPWPSSSLVSREAARVSVRAIGTNGVRSNWAELTLEAALLNRADWKADLISGPTQGVDKPKRPFRMRKTFQYDSGSARLYATAHGIYQVEINGQVVGDQVLSPGWQSYQHRLHYQTYDITGLLHPGRNTVGVYLGEGWFAGRLGRPGVSNIWGDRLGFLCQLEVNSQLVCKTDDSWEVLADGPVLSSEIYDGEVYDSREHDASWSTAEDPSEESHLIDRAEILPFPKAELIAPETPPVRRIIELKPQEIITTPSGKKVLDFGQNLAGWLRVNVDIPGTGTVTIRHAEVMENGELGTRPLRTAKARAVIHLGGQTRGYEPKFTFYGFRYAEVAGYDACSLSDFTAVVVSSDLRRTGTFECSHDMLNKLHQNTIWSMRGNFVSVPTDCPQRDERLGWTGDIQVFTPTASFLYDTAAFIGGWLRDVESGQRDLGGVVPNIVPSIPMPPKHTEKRAMAAWGDTVILTPWDLYQYFGDEQHLRKQWESMRQWLNTGIPRDERGFYSTESPQFGDWLDPRSPPALPGHSPTDPYLVANAYLVHVTKVASEVADLLGEVEDALHYRDEAQRLRKLFRAEYISPRGRLSSDTQTGYVLALHFNLLDSELEIQTAQCRLDWLTRWGAFKINTGFVGTPYVLPALARVDKMSTAYRMLQERDCPSWLYPITMGATTIWERWNSMLPDGSINPGQMTSFNHYALGSVCHFLHAYVAGLSSALPGWKSAIIRPRPGGTIRWARATYDSPVGPYSVSWKCEANVMKTSVSIPPNAEARIILPGIDVVNGSGEHFYETEWHVDSAWPPKILQGIQGAPVEASYVP